MVSFISSAASSRMKVCYAIRNYSEIELFAQVNQLYCQSVKEFKNALDMFLYDCSRLWKVGWMFYLSSNFQLCKSPSIFANAI